MNPTIFQSIRMLAVMTVLTGVLYPLAVTGIAQFMMHDAANGSLVVKKGHVVGSTLIGQSFGDAKHFWSRPSATSPMAYNAGASSGSNQGPTNPALAEAVTGRVKALQNAGSVGAPPVDLVTASASGLDPHVSPAAAEYQVARVAKVRGISEQAVRDLVAQHTEGRTFGVLGEARVNVLALNLALDAAKN